MVSDFFLQERERKAEEERIRTENLLKGNPLLNQDKGGFKIKRRYRLSSKFRCVSIRTYADGMTM